MKQIIGMRTLIAYLATVGTLILVSWKAPDALAVVVTALIALFGLLLGKKKDEPTDG